MATTAEIQTAFKAIYRTDLNATVAASIAGSGISLDAYIASQLPQVASTTQAAVAIASFVTGIAPTSDKLDALKVAADAQVASYTALGVGNPSLGAYEAFGRSFATDATTTAGFNTKYGALSTADFIGVVYGQVYGSTPTAAAAANLTAQITYFTNLFTVNGVANAALAAKGAVLGQIVGYAFVSPASANSALDNQVASLLTSAAKGDTTVYAKALPAAVDPGSVGVTITLAGTVTDAVGPNAADPAFKSTAFNDTVQGNYLVGAKIDAGAGEDLLKINVASAAAVIAPATGDITNVETITVTTTGAAAVGGLNLTDTTGYKTVGFLDGTTPGSFTNLAAGTALSIVDTTPLTASQNASFALKTDTAADVANLTINGFNTATATLTGYEIVNLTASGNDSNNAAFTLADANLKTLSITATKALTATLDSTVLETITGTGAGAVTLTNVSNLVTTVDFSGATGAASVVNVGSSASIIKGGAGADVFGGISKSGAVVTGGAGNDQITFTLTGTGSATVTGGAGADTITTVAGGTTKVTAVYTAASESSVTNTDSIVNFDKGQDKIDLKALALTTDKTALNTFTSLTAIADGTDYFSGKAVAYGQFNGGGDFFVLADVNGNGKFDVNTDLIVKVNAGAGNVLITDFIFA